MRLIGTFTTEQEAYAFYAFLLKEKIQNIYELGKEEGTHAKQYRIWVYDENDLEKAEEWLKRYNQDPHDPLFEAPVPSKKPIPPTPAYAEISEKEDLKWRSHPLPLPKMRKVSLVLTRLVILLCILLFFINSREEVALLEAQGVIAVEIAQTPLQQTLLFDEPSSYAYIEKLLETVPIKEIKEIRDLPPEALSFLKQAEEAPSWRGLIPFVEEVYTQGWEKARVPWFEKISQGQVWRLFTPCLLHRDFLHILFNMIWAWVLLKQLEARMSRAKLCLLIVILAVVSNVAQYLMSGPYFLGFSGVVVGLAGFIWVRQKCAPWEGYTVHKSTLLFLLFFVLAMFAIEVITFLLHVFSVIQVIPHIANTAHIAGGLLGLLLGRLSFFKRRAP
jgi:GlpG protein